MRTEQMTIRQQMDDQAAAQALLRVEAEVRRLCREASAPAKLAEDVVWRAREVFRPLNGRIFPVAPDGKTVLRAKDSENVLTAAEWTRAQLAAAGALPLLQLAGFTPGAGAPDQALALLSVLYALVPCGLKLLAIGLLLVTPIPET